MIWVIKWNYSWSEKMLGLAAVLVDGIFRRIFASGLDFDLISLNKFRGLDIF